MEIGQHSRRSAAFFAAIALILTSAASASVEYKIDSHALVPLSSPRATGAKIQIHRIPVDGKLESLDLEPFDLYSKDADIKVLGANDEILERLTPPPLRLYRGMVAGDPDSLVFISVGATRIDGVVFKDDRRFGIGSRRRAHKERTRDDEGGEGVDVFIRESEPAEDIPIDGTGFMCDVDGAGIAQKPTLAAVVHDLRPRAESALSTATARWVMNMAIETDYELYVNVGSSTSNVTTFITNLIGAMSAIYDRELTTQVQISSLTINSSISDPFTVVPGTAGTWNGSPHNCTSPFTPPNDCLSTLHALLEFGDRWHNSPPSANPRSTTALISGKTQTAGIAWIQTLCTSDFLCSGGNCGSSDANGHYGGRYSYNGGVSPGNPPLVPDPDANAPVYTAPASNYWPLLQVSHETGHNVFSSHTHCKVLSAGDQVTYGRVYVDKCYGSEGGCYSGAVSVPAEKGTIMSYCHLLGGGSQTRFIFGKAGEASHVMPEELKAAIQAATPSLSAITAPSALNAGASGLASVANVGGVTYLWSITNGVINSGQGTSSINFTANTDPTTVTIKATNSAGCSITDSKAVTVNTVSYGPPTGVTATATSGTSVSISWSAPGGTTPVQYDVYRSSNGTTYSQINTVAHPTTTYSDNTASANTAYLYKVRSAGAGGTNESADSNRDLATTVIFTDDPLVATATVVKATHVTQLRTAVNAVRSLASLGAGSYTDPSLVVGTTLIKAAHLNDLRSALDAARSTLSLTALTYAETITATTTGIKASHVTELRNGVK